MTGKSEPSLAWDVETKEHPFIYQDADVILMAADDIEFRVHKFILTLASLFFRSMFSLPQPPPSDHPPDSSIDPRLTPPIPIINVAEKSSVLYHLLRIIYPIKDPVLVEPGDVFDALVAALKYEMEDATDFLTARLASLATDNPLRIYVMACTFDLDDVAQLAAKEVLRQKAYTTTAVIPELDTITAGVYYRLLRYCGSNGLAEEVLSFVHPPAQSSPGIDSAAQNGDTSRSITNAPHPFDREDADIVLCSSDLVHFRVHSAILRMASPYLRDKLTESSQELPDCCKESTTALRSLPVITLAEDSLTISSLLRVYYEWLLNTPDDEAMPIIDMDIGWIQFVAAEKYGMTKATQTLKKELAELSASKPLQVYLIASRHKIQQIAIDAARQSLQEHLFYLIGMEDITARSYYNLIKYRRRCWEIACDMSEEFSWMESSKRHSFDPPRGCLSYDSSNYALPCWHVALLEQVRLDISAPVGCPSTLPEAYLQSCECFHCRDNSSDDVRRFAEYFDQVFHEKVYEENLLWD